MFRGNSVSGPDSYILLYWMQQASRRMVSVGRQDRLMAAIRQVIFESSKDADRTFVYVAFKEGQILISNDETDIVFGPDWEGRQSPRRNRLLRDTRRLRPQGADILTSQEAYAQIQGT
jgi:hypothetical protein